MLINHWSIINFVISCQIELKISRQWFSKMLIKNMMDFFRIIIQLIDINWQLINFVSYHSSIAVKVTATSTCLFPMGACYYRSESPSQVFIILVKYLKTVLEHVPVAKWEKFGLAYDNMCHLNDLRAARKPLPKDLFPAPYDEMWMKVTKIIDELHIRNHKSECQSKYPPDKLRELHPDSNLNTMAAEQTFVWLSRFKKLLCAMPKNHHNFFLHRMITRRNHYTAWCHSKGRSLVLPKVRSVMTT